MQPIKNIIFDLGGVFIDIHYHLTQKAFENLGITNFHTLFTQHHASDIFEQLETGKITEAEFYTAFRKETQSNLSDNEIKTAWNALLGRFSADKIEWLKSIKSHYKIFLFSNTNQIHFDAFIKLYEEDFGNSNFNDLFTKAYYSHIIGLRKPYPESFKYVLQEQKLNAAETLFIDDTLQNVEGAKIVGLQTIHLKPNISLLHLQL